MLRSPKWKSAISLAHLSILSFSAIIGALDTVDCVDTRLSALSRGLLFLAGSNLSSNGIIISHGPPSILVIASSRGSNLRGLRLSCHAELHHTCLRGAARRGSSLLQSLTVNKVTCGGVI